MIVTPRTPAPNRLNIMDRPLWPHGRMAAHRCQWIVTRDRDTTHCVVHVVRTAVRRRTSQRLCMGIENTAEGIVVLFCPVQNMVDKG